MNERALREEINEKRKELTEENRKVYEDMLTYLRLSYNKSERETEEILLELLNHLLEAQKAGKSAEEIFGPDPKRLAKQIVGELPALIPSKWLRMIAMERPTFSPSVLCFLVGLIWSCICWVKGHGSKRFMWAQ